VIGEELDGGGIGLKVIGENEKVRLYTYLIHACFFSVIFFLVSLFLIDGEV
jgi:hypothetical protein